MALIQDIIYLLQRTEREIKKDRELAERYPDDFTSQYHDNTADGKEEICHYLKEILKAEYKRRK